MGSDPIRCKGPLSMFLDIFSGRSGVIPALSSPSPQPSPQGEGARRDRRVKLHPLQIKHVVMVHPLLGERVGVRGTATTHKQDHQTYLSVREIFQCLTNPPTFI